MPTTDELQQQINALTQRVDAITAPPTNYYTHRYSGEEIDNGVQGGLLLGIPSSKQQALRNIGGRPNRNLLDNAYFVGGGSQQGGGQFPINQRGQTSYTTWDTIDRWICNYGATVTINSSGAVISRTSDGSADIFVQKLPLSLLSQLAGQVVTLSAIINGQLGSSTFTMPADLSTLIDSPEIIIDGLYFDIYDVPSGGNCRARFFSGSTSQFTLTAAKLELGPVQTLAYQDEDGNWQLFETPDFQEEQAKCQAYQVVIKTLDIIGGTNNATTLYANIPTPVTMRALPAIENNGVFNVRGGGTNQTNLTATVYSSSLNANGIRVGIAGQFAVNEPYHVLIASPIILNAGL